jgi:hypothetical protein
MGMWVFLERLWPGLPLVLYLLVLAITRKRQLGPIADRFHGVLDQQSASSLTLLGFNITVISLLVTLHNEKRSMENAVFLFSVSTACFLGAYILLHLRLIAAFRFLSDALMTNGIWLIILGCRALFRPFREFEHASNAFLFVVFIFVAYLVIDVTLKLRGHSVAPPSEDKHG